MPEWGFTDSVAQLHRPDRRGSSADALYNPFAAVPSMHVAFALMLGVPMARDGAPRVGQGAVAGLPAARHVRGRGDREPLVVRRVHRRAHGRRGGARGAGFARWRPAAWAWSAAGARTAAAQQAV